MSEVRINRTRKVKVENPDSASTVSLFDLLGSIVRGIHSLASESSRQAVPTTAAPAAAGIPIVVKAELVPIIQANSSLAAARLVHEPVSAVVAAELKAIVSEAPYVTRCHAQEISSLVQTVIASAGDQLRLATSIKALRTSVNADFEKITAETVFLRVRDSLAEISFTPEIIRPESGYILARQGSVGPQIRVDVRRADGGGVEIETDADGFHANSCQTALDQLEEKLKGKGVHLQGGFRRPKRNRYAAIRQAVRQR